MIPYSFLSNAIMNTMTKKQLGEERVYLTYVSGSQSITEGSQGRNSSWSRGKNHRRMPHWFAFSLVFSCLAYISQAYLPRMALPTVTFGSHINQRAWKCPHRHAHRPIWWRHFLDSDSLSQTRLGCVKRTRTDQHRYLRATCDYGTFQLGYFKLKYIVNIQYTVGIKNFIRKDKTVQQ